MFGSWETAGRCPLKREFFEYHALIRQEARDPGSVPEVTAL